jgi:hypothetical protein
MHSTRTTALAVVGVALAAAVACGRESEPKPPVVPPTPAVPTVILAIPQHTEDVAAEPTAVPSNDLSTGIADGLRQTGNTALEELFWQDDPTGTGPQIALRFVRALQRRDYVAAARELDGGGRLALSGDTMGHLRRVMDDVYTNAKLTGAGRCTSASELTRESAVLRCGTRRVVVHVLNTSLYSGVEIDPWHPQYDVYRGPHTHAFTALDL